MAANFGLVNGAAPIFFANFGGLIPQKVAVPSAAQGIRLGIPVAMGDSLGYLPFSGEVQILHGLKRENRIEFTPPPLQRGAVVGVVGEN